jgi:fructose transport system permease protein
VADQAGPTKTISDFEAKLTEADKTVASFDRDDRTLGHMVRGILRNYPTIIPTLILVLAIACFGIVAHNFLKLSTLSLVLQQVTVTGIVAIAQTIVILTAGIDLSVGAILVVSSFVMGRLATQDNAFGETIAQAGLQVPLAIMIGIALAAFMGWINGALVTYLKLPPFIVTLGMLSNYTFFKLWYSKSESVRADVIEKKASSLLWFGNDLHFGQASITYGGIALLLLAVAVWYLLNRTAWGRHVHAMGDDPDAALLAGIRTNYTLVSVYALAGLICGIGAWISIGRVGSVSPIGFETVNLDSITAVVIGGTSLFGGRGSIIGSVLGAMIVGVFSTGLSLAGVDSIWQYLAAGCLVIFAVAVDQWLRRASQ